MLKKKKKCCICGCVLDGYGNNPDGAMLKDHEGNIIELQFEPGDRCCNLCDDRYVIPGRLYKLARGR